MNATLIDAVAEVLRSAASQAILPRYKSLLAGQIEYKAPDEIVTVADREAEAIIAHGLSLIRPHARFVGEEACASAPALLQWVEEGLTWVVDPIDGTSNFAAGRPPFALMAALLKDGETIASWLLDPLADRLAVAELGGGAWVNGERVHTPAGCPAFPEMRGLISQAFAPESSSAAIDRIASAVGEILPSRRCAGDEYPRVASGDRHFTIYWRTLVWDHAPGALFLSEAGGVARRHDGSPYRPGRPGTGMLLAQNEAIFEKIAGLLHGS